MKKLLIIVLLFIAGKALSANIRGTLTDANNQPIKGATVALVALQGGQIVAQTITADNGFFELQNVKTDSYLLQCSFVGYHTYQAEIQVDSERDFDLGTIVMTVQNVEIDEVEVAASRNVFSFDKQIIYPSERQVNASSGGLDLLQKMHIPLVEVDAISQSVKSLDPSGGIALYINDIPAEPDEAAIITPADVKRIEVSRNPGASYGDNVAMAINIITKFSQDGIDLGITANNSLKLVYGYNNAFVTYNHKHSQLTISRAENFQNYKNQSVSDARHYLLPNGEWHDVEINSNDVRKRMLTESTMLKYNLTLPDNLVLQLQGRIGKQRNPKQMSELLVSETNEEDYINNKNICDEYTSPSLNVYFKKFFPNKQSLVINAVGTRINSDYDYLCEQMGSDFSTHYAIDGKKSSVIGEAKYAK